MEDRKGRRLGINRVLFYQALSRRTLANEAALHDLLFRSQHGGRVQTVNLHHLQLCDEHALFRAATAEATHFTADGWPVVLLFSAFGRRVGRVTGSDLVDRLASDSFPGVKRVALYGATQDVGDEFSRLLERQSCKVVVRRHDDAVAWRALEEAQRCLMASVDLVLVAVSPPRGEVFAASLHSAAPALRIVGVGGAVDMTVGAQHRPPAILGAMGLEWAGRLAADPKRLWRRYIASGLPFFVRVLLPSAAVAAARRLGRATSR